MRLVAPVHSSLTSALYNACHLCDQIDEDLKKNLIELFCEVNGKDLIIKFENFCSILSTEGVSHQKYVPLPGLPVVCNLC